MTQPQGGEDEACGSSYDIGGGEVLACTGEHLRGNSFRAGGVVHQARAYGANWTWYSDESDQARDARPAASRVRQVGQQQ